MEALNFISEQGLLASGKISKKTLDRYAESGHLPVHINAEGSRRYRLEDLSELFGISGLEADETKEPLADDQHLEKQSTPPLQKGERLPPLRTLGPTWTPGPLPPTAAASDTTDPAVDEQITSDTVTSGPMPVADTSTAVLEPSDTGPSAAGPSAAGPSATEPSATAPAAKVEVDDPATGEETNAVGSAEREESRPSGVPAGGQGAEIERFLRLLEHQENLLEDREVRIRELVEERRWLRDRVEKLEEQLARTQVLMLSGNQTIQELVSQQRPGASPIRRALAWLGIAQLPQPASPSADAMSPTAGTSGELSHGSSFTDEASPAAEDEEIAEVIDDPQRARANLKEKARRAVSARSSGSDPRSPSDQRRRAGNE